MEQKKVKTYDNAKIYRIVCNETGLQYIGSTCRTLSARLSAHKSNYKCYLNGNFHFITSFKILENDNFDIVLLENLKNCKSKDELHQRERYYIDSMECVNKFIPGRTQKEYQKEYGKKHREENKDYYREQTKKRGQVIINCPCGCTYKGLSVKARHERTKKHIQNMLKLEQN